MGLDVSAFSKLVFVRAHHPADDYDDEDLICFYPASEGFASRMEGMEPGLYRCDGPWHGFRAGSYGGYNHWREGLAALVGTTPQTVWEDSDADGPFVELINFSDCEGTIGPVVSAKLAKDFAEWHDRAVQFANDEQEPDEADYWLRKYDDWAKAFALAANDGAVRLH